MLLFILADDLVTDLGRIAAIVLTLYLFLFVVLFLVVSGLLLAGNTWLKDKVELLHNLRLIIQNVDTAMHAPSSETLPATLEPDNRLGQAIQAIHMVQSANVEQIARNTQKQVDAVEKKVEPVADRIAEGVIEFRARTVMAQGMLKAFFLPGLIKLKPRSPILLPAPLDTDVPADGSSLRGESSNVVIIQQNLPGTGVHTTRVMEPEHLESEGSERSDNAPGH